MPDFIRVDKAGEGFAGLSRLASSPTPMARTRTLSAHKPRGAPPVILWLDAIRLKTLREIEKTIPRFFLFGYLGTSPWRVKKSFRRTGLKTCKKSTASIP